MAMKTGFGWIQIGDRRYDSDLVLVDIGDGLVRVKERDKSHAEIKYGTSHVIDWEEIKVYLEPWGGVQFEHFFLGTGQYGMAKLDPEARRILEKKGFKIHVKKTPQALAEWEETKGKKIGIFHVTC